MPLATFTQPSRPTRRPRHGFATLARVAVLVTASAALSAFGQTATIYGSAGNFDVVNNTGQNACGLEAEIEGVPHGHPIGYFPAQR